MSQGVPPVVCSSTAAIADTLLNLGARQLSSRYRVKQSLPALADGDFAAKLPNGVGKNDVHVSAERPSIIAPLPPTKENNMLPLGKKDFLPNQTVADAKASVAVMAPAAFVYLQGHGVIGGMNGSRNGSYVLPPSKEQECNNSTVQVLLLSSVKKTITFGVDTESKSTCG